MITPENLDKVLDELSKRPAAMAAFRDCCKAADVEIELKPEEMWWKCKKICEKKMVRYSTEISCLKQVRLPEIESRIKKLKLLKEDALRDAMSFLYDKYDAGKGRWDDNQRPISNGKSIFSYRYEGWEHRHKRDSRRVYFTVPDFEKLPKKLKLKMVDMQMTLLWYDRYKLQQELKEAKERHNMWKMCYVSLGDRCNTKTVAELYDKIVKQDVTEALNDARKNPQKG